MGLLFYSFFWLFFFCFKSGFVAKLKNWACAKREAPSFDGGISPGLGQIVGKGEEGEGNRGAKNIGEVWGRKKRAEAGAGKGKIILLLFSAGDKKKKMEGTITRRCVPVFCPRPHVYMYVSSWARIIKWCFQSSCKRKDIWRINGPVWIGPRNCISKIGKGRTTQPYCFYSHTSSTSLAGRNLLLRSVESISAKLHAHMTAASSSISSWASAVLSHRLYRGGV